MDCAKYKELLKDDGLREYLSSKDINAKMLVKYDYFIAQIGKNCAYADACIKIMKEDIDGYYTGRKANNS